MTRGSMTPRRTIRGSTLAARLAVGAALGIAGMMLTAAPAAAQIAAAIGKPLPSPDLPVGTITVRVVAGTPAQPVVGTAVTLTVNGAAREARTDAAGRATFAGLPPGATVSAKVAGEDKAPTTSDEFAIPGAGGTRVLLSTKEWQPGAGGGAPFAGGGGGEGGMPNPRQLSGVARPDQNRQSGTITVRVAYDDFKDTPEGVAVVLVGYTAADTTTYHIARTDKAGRVQFAELDRSGGTAYYAMTELPRNGSVDRVMSSWITLDSQAGVALALSGEKRDSKAPAIDDLTKGNRQDSVPAGKVAVVLEGVPDASARVTLVDAESKKAIGAAGLEPAKPQSQDDPARFVASFDVPAAPGQAMYAECTDRGQHYRSMPFQLLEATGSKISVYVYPRLMFRFQLQSAVEDQLLAVQGRFEIANNSWAPYRGGPDGTVIALPHGFKGGVVFDPDQSEVSVSAGEGFRIMRPIPPVGRQFHGGFSLAVDGGKVAWSFDLPLGSYESQLAIKQTPGMMVQTPPGVSSESQTVPQGTFSVLGPITIKPGQSMAMAIDGLPSPPAWRRWVAGATGFLVVAVIIGGVILALVGRPARPVAAAAVAADARRQRLLDQLVELERTGGNPRRREQLLDELEKLWV